MGEGSDSYHEPYELLSEDTREMHRALVSLMEELEAIDWYQQRIDACEDEELQAILAHNRREEAEHAMMTLEWIRRRAADVAEFADVYLGTEGAIAGGHGEEHGHDGDHGGAAADGSLGIASLREDRR